MTLQHFNTLCTYQQYRYIIVDGSFLIQRKTKDADILLFQLGQQYVEFYFNEEGNEIIKSRSFEDTDELFPYLSHINVSELMVEG